MQSRKKNNSPYTEMEENTFTWKDVVSFAFALWAESYDKMELKVLLK